MAWLAGCGRSRRGKNCVRCSRPRPSWRGRGSWHASRQYRQRSRGWRQSRELSRRSRMGKGAPADRLGPVLRNVMYVLLVLLPTVRGEHTLVGSYQLHLTSPRIRYPLHIRRRAPAPSLATGRRRFVRLVVRRVADGCVPAHLLRGPAAVGAVRAAVRRLGLHQPLPERLRRLHHLARNPRRRLAAAVRRR